MDKIEIGKERKFKSVHQLYICHHHTFLSFGLLFEIVKKLDFKGNIVKFENIRVYSKEREKLKDICNNLPKKKNGVKICIGRLIHYY